MDDKIVNLLLDIVKYVFTVLLVYPVLTGMDKDWMYYAIVSAAVVITAGAAFAVRHFAEKKKKKKDKSESKNKYKYKYKYKQYSK